MKLENAQKENDVIEALRVLDEEMYTFYRLNPFGYEVNTEFRIWLLSNCTEFIPSRSEGYYDNVAYHKEDKILRNKEFPEMVERTTYKYFGDFSVRTNSFYDELLKLNIRNLRIEVELCGIKVYSTTSENSVSANTAIDYFYNVLAPTFYKYENYLVCQHEDYLKVAKIPQ